MTPHQFNLFPHKESRKSKVPISRERVEAAKKFIEERNVKGAVEALRDIRYGLENFLKRIK